MGRFWSIPIASILIVDASASASQDLTSKFECAVLAAIAGDEGEVDRLFAYGLEAARSAMPELKGTPGWSESLGPWSRAADLSDDFWIGAFWMSAHMEIWKLIEGKLPIEPGLPYDIIRPERERAARVEFRERNCHLLAQE